MRSHRPILVAVSGAPGSGKSTLARTLAEQLRIPHLERDTFFDGMDLTLGGPVDRKTTGIYAFYQVVTAYLEQGVSLVIDGTLYRGISERDLTEFFSRAHVINVHCRTSNSHERFKRRELKRGSDRAWLAKHLEHLERIHPQVSEPLDLEWEIIQVDTTDHCSPSVETIAAQIRHGSISPATQSI